MYKVKNVEGNGVGINKSFIRSMLFAGTVLETGFT